MNKSYICHTNTTKNPTYLVAEIFDPSFGTQDVARQIANGLRPIEIVDLTEREAAHLWGNISYTFPWYNGRERGIGFSRQNYKNDIFVITWGEWRSSDSIFVDCWTVKQGSALNPPTLKDFTYDAYKNRKTFQCGHINEAVEYITEKVKECYQEDLKIVRERMAKEEN